ncbi:hypothetical protein RZN22_03220 [Bacillaceae bacterium S4-13-58]
MRKKRKEHYRMITVQRKMTHEKLVNEILSLGSDVRVETMRFQSLQKHSKQTTRNQKKGENQSEEATWKINSKASQFNHIKGEYNKNNFQKGGMILGNF